MDPGDRPDHSLDGGFRALIRASIRKPGFYAFLMLGLILALALILDRSFPLPLEGRPLAQVVLDRQGVPLRVFADDQGIWRFPARPTQVSPLYLEALLAYEDRWFYYHPGINPLAVARALIQNLAQGRVISGGSTITMQVARILARPPGPGSSRIRTKIIQMLRALQLESHLTKDQILGLYLTHAPFGANIQGVRAAALTWLGKDAKDLTHAEAALLAVLPQAPSRFRPDRHPDRAVLARDKVLDRMARFNLWSGDTVRAARQEPVIPMRFPQPMAAPLAARRLRGISIGTGACETVISTLLDHETQIHVEQVLKDHLSGLARGVSGAVLVVNHKTLAVRAYAGSADFFDPACQGHVDMVRAIRSPGSALKPFIYGLALDEGLIHSHSMLLDVPRFGRPYDPGNFTRGFSGPVTVARALTDSLNLPAVQVLEALGPGNFHDRLRHGGARFEFPGKPNLSMALGGAGTNLESLVTLYTALARGGIAARPRLRPEDTLHERFLMSPGAAWIIREILSRPLPGQEDIARLSGERALAWKTGTSYGFRDAWALGIQGDFVVGVWVGRPDGSPCPGQYGALTALPLMAQVMEGLDRSGVLPGMPDSVTRAKICWPSGLAASRIRGRAAGACAREHEAWILEGRIPPTMTMETGLAASLVRRIWVDAAGHRASPVCGGVGKKKVALWPWQAEPFIPKAWRRTHIIPEDSGRCPGLSPMALPRMRIVSVSDQSILCNPPGRSHDTSVPLEALGGRGRLHWFLNQVPVSARPVSGPLTMPIPGPGNYQLAVVDETGNSDMVRFRVIQAP